ncbi:MAG: zinc-ribbon domain-containing protein [Anaerolineae bacterium]|nr:zinc-ribbon domain-containing protein [Anaerolineae bacterium]
MSDLIDKIVEGAGQVISEVDKGGRVQSAVTGLRQRMAEADRKRKIAAVKQQIQDLQAKEAQAINALSAQVLALYEAGTLTQPELVSLCKGVDEIRARIEEKESELQQIEPAPPPPTPGVAPGTVPEEPATGTRCPNCGVAVVAGAAFCQSCGAPLAPKEPPAPVHFCVHCGAQLREGARFCPKCGQGVPHSP